MAIRSASAGTSATLGFTNQRDGDFSETRRMQDRRGGDGRGMIFHGVRDWRHVLFLDPHSFLQTRKK
jgi:hypothetical protein